MRRDGIERSGCDLLQMTAGGGGNNLPVPDTLGAHQALAHGDDLACPAAQDEHLEAVVLVEVHVQRRHHRLVMLVLDVGQFLRQAGRVVVVDQRHHGDLVGAVLFLARPFVLDKLLTDEIPNRLRPVRVPAPSDEAIEPGQQILFQRDGGALQHGSMITASRAAQASPSTLVTAPVKTIGGSRRFHSELARVAIGADVDSETMTLSAALESNRELRRSQGLARLAHGDGGLPRASHRKGHLTVVAARRRKGRVDAARGTMAH